MPDIPLRVLSIFGTRPEAVKMAPVIAELSRRREVRADVCVTAQHREMLDQVLTLFKITPEYDLDLMQTDQSLDELTAAVFTHLGPVLEAAQPDWVLVQGDTTTVMAAALLASYHRVRVGHVEAGLRTQDKWNPFPEEINRRVAGCVADLHFAPTESARNNLLREGVPVERIAVTGNTVIDALQQVVQMPYDFKSGPLSFIEENTRVVLVTAHRRENFGTPLERICSAVKELAGRYPDTAFVYPVHLNPNVQEPARRLLGGVRNVHLLAPLDYLPMAHLLKRAHLVLTDSGGLQEEAPALGTPVLVLRDVTERPEGIAAGTARLVGTDAARIVSEAGRLLDHPQEHDEMARSVNPYGDGHAAVRIVDRLLQASR
ncbi:MAG: UDP-N-acetylglucosamine 2-epimerase (non-hydrolyzing) [Anaerolineales bacterium]|nr:UDP-N-acetylglucosamine 2-epimerase (non-hydrolyzing) [Anaerolineales bacterium]